MRKKQGHKTIVNSVSLYTKRSFMHDRYSNEAEYCNPSPLTVGPVPILNEIIMNYEVMAC